MNTNDPKPTQAWTANNLVSLSEGLLESWLENIDEFDWVKGELDINSWRSFLKAAANGVDANVALKEVARRIAAAGDIPPMAKLHSQIRRTYQRVKANPGNFSKLVIEPQVKFSLDKLKKVATKVTGVDEVWLAGRSAMPPAQVTSEQFLNALYKTGEKIILFNDCKSRGEQIFEVNAESKVDDALRSGPKGIWFLGNPVDGLEHPNPDLGNKMSRRSKESVTAFRYLLIESDEDEAKEWWLRCLVQLPLKIAAIYTSGGDSIHALVRVDATSKEHWDEICRKTKPILLTLGACRGSLTAVRLTRLPGCKREETNQMQRLLYINPNPEAKPILELPAIDAQTTTTTQEKPNA